MLSLGLDGKFLAPSALARLDALAQAIIDAAPNRRMHAALEFEARFRRAWLSPTTKTMIVRQLITDLSRRIERENHQAAEDRYVIPQILRFAQRDLNRTARSKPLEFIGLDFSSLMMRRLRLSGIQFIDCRFDAANLEGSVFDASVFLNCTFTSATLAGASLQRADFSGADFNGANFFEADARRALFLRARLDNVDFSFANLSGANLGGSSLAGVCFHDANLAGALLEAAENLDQLALREAARLP